MASAITPTTIAHTAANPFWISGNWKFKRLRFLRILLLEFRVFACLSLQRASEFLKRIHLAGVITSPTRIVPPLTISALKPPRWINPRRAPLTVNFSM